MTKTSTASTPAAPPARPEWRSLVRLALATSPDGTAHLTALYAAVEKLAPAITKQREHWKAKVRQCVQKDDAIEHVSQGVWRLRSSGIAANDSTHGRKAA
ncbi:MAG: hypothetical protein ACHREM_09560 [Polyangiales bacterium]